MTSLNMGEPEDKKQIFFTNLLLLGFDPTSMERRWRIPFNKEMFLLPNKKGFETVMHFLFNRLNSVRCKEEFRDCWPVNDKKQEQQFRRVCHDWLTYIVKEDDEAVFPRIVASIFLSPGGERFLELLLYFTSYILLKVSQTEHGLKRRDYLQHPVMTTQTQSSGLTEIMEKGIHCSIVRLRTRFLTRAQKTCAVQDTWKSYAVDLVKSYRGRTKASREKERQLRGEHQQAADRGASRGSPVATRRMAGVLEYDYDIQSVRRAQKVQKVREMWRTLEDYTESRTKEEEIVESILHGALEKYRIDAGDLDIKIPDLLLRQCEQEIQRRGIENIYQGGKLNLISLIHLWNLSLHLYINKLNQAGVPSFEETLPLVTSQVHTHHSHLTNIQALRLKLEMEVLPEIKESIRKLKTRLDSEVFSHRSPDSIRTTSLGLGLLPPTPPVSFEPIDTKTPKDGAGQTHLDNIKMPRDPVSTPEAAEELMDSISERVRARQDMVVHGSPLYGPKARTTQHNRLPSKLPVRGEVAVEKIGSKQRTRFMSVPTVMKDSHVKKTPSGTTLEVLPGSKQHTAKHSLTSQRQAPRHHHVSPPDPNIHRTTSTTKDKEGFKVPQMTVRSRKPSNNSKKTLAPRIERHVDGGNTPKSQRILADKIVDAVLNGTPPDTEPYTADYLVNPLTELGEQAFVSNNKLSRTPATGQRPTWHDSLLHDSVGPLSSTRVDHSARQPPDKNTDDPVATKLFSPDDSDTEDHVFTIRADSSSRLVTESGTTLHQYRPHLARVRAASPFGDNIPSSISSISPQSDRSSNHGRDKSDESQDKRQSTLINELERDQSPDNTLHEEDDFLLQEILCQQANSAKQGKSSRPAHSANNNSAKPGNSSNQVNSSNKANTDEHAYQPSEDLLGLSKQTHQVKQANPSHQENRSSEDLLGLDFGAKPQNPQLEQLRTPGAGISRKSFMLSPFSSPAQIEEAADSLVDSMMLNTNNSSLTGDDSLGEDCIPGLEAAHELYQSMLQTKTPCLPARSRANRPGAGATSQKTSVESRSRLDKVMTGTMTTRASGSSKNSSNNEDSSGTEDSIRVIRFQDGSFSEFLDKSPAKTPSKSSVRFSKSLEAPAQSQASPLKVMKDELDKTTDNLLAQCQQLVEKVQSPAKPKFRKPEKPSDRFDKPANRFDKPADRFEKPSDQFLTEKDVLRGGAKPKPLPFISETPTMSFMDSYLKTSPPPGKYGNLGNVTAGNDSQSFVVKKFTLDIDSDEEETIYQERSVSGNHGNRPPSHRDEEETIYQERSVSGNHGNRPPSHRDEEETIYQERSVSGNHGNRPPSHRDEKETIYQERSVSGNHGNRPPSHRDEEETIYQERSVSGNHGNRPPSHRDEIHKHVSALAPASLTSNKRIASLERSDVLHRHPGHRDPGHRDAGFHDPGHCDHYDRGIMDETPQFVDDDYLDFGIASLDPRSTARPAVPGSPSCVPATLGLSTYPLSPYTDALHKTTTPSNSHKSQTWDDLFKEDASCLLPASPASPHVGNLVDL